MFTMTHGQTNIKEIKTDIRDVVEGNVHRQVLVMIMLRLHSIEYAYFRTHTSLHRYIYFTAVVVHIGQKYAVINSFIMVHESLSGWLLCDCEPALY
jgi:hypothetical protein